jgi:hypothetical protein
VAAAGYIGGPPLPPRTPAVLAAQAKMKSPLQTPRAGNGNNVPAASLDSSAAASAAPAVLRGSQSLSLLYRYPLLDHSSSSLPGHLMDLAFPMLPPEAASCGQGEKGTIGCVKDSTKIDAALNDSDAAAAGSVANASTPSSRSSSNASTIDTDFYGFPITTASAAAASQGQRSSSSTSTNRLFNLVCTQEDGSFLHGCVLQITQLETIEEKWDEIVLVPQANDGAEGDAVVVPGSGIGADVLSRERRRSTEKKRDSLTGGAGSGALAPPSDAALAATTTGRKASLTGSSTSTSSSSTLSVSTSAPLSSGAPSTPSSASQKLSALFDGFAKDVKQLVERVKQEDQNQGEKEKQSAAATQVPIAAPVGSSTEVAASTSTPDTSPLPLVPSSSPVPGPSTSPSIPVTALTGGRPVSGSGFYALAGASSAAETAGATSAGLVGGLAAVASVAADGATPARPKPRPRPTQMVHHHHRIFRVQTQYAIVLLTKQPLFNLLRSALTHLLQNARGTIAPPNFEEEDNVMERERAGFLASFPTGLKGAIYELFHCAAFSNLLLYTRVPSHSLDLFGLGATQCTPAYLTVPPLDFHFDLLFRCLHPRRLLLVLECLICERRVLLVSASNSMLTLAGQSLLSLLYPFHWRYLYIPILPFSLFKYLACPTPFLIGVHACFRRKARELAERDVVTVDLDHDEVFMPPVDTGGSGTSTEASFHLPSTVREQLLAHAARLFQSDVSDLDTDGGSIAPAAATADDSATSILTATASHRLHHFASADLTPEKPAVDEEGRKLLDTYANAEAPRLQATSEGLRSGGGAGSSSAAASSSSSSTPTVSISASEKAAERERTANITLIDATLGSPTKERPPSDSSDPPAPLPDVFSPTTAPSLSPPARAAPSALSTSSGPPPSSASLRSLLLQLEFVKIWSHLLKQFRQYAIILPSASTSTTFSSDHADSSSGGGGILLFDSPAFLATKPEHYQPFLTTLLNTSYFPAFLHERTGPSGLDQVRTDAFDRYEASLSGARVQIWQQAYAYQSAAKKAAVEHRLRGTPLPLAFSPSRRADFSRWLHLYRSSGIDPSLHHVKYLEGWNVDSNRTWSEVNRMPRRWFTGKESEGKETSSGIIAAPTPAKERLLSPATSAAPAVDSEQPQQASSNATAQSQRKSSSETPRKMSENLLLSYSQQNSPATTLRPSHVDVGPTSEISATAASTTVSASRDTSPVATPSGTPRVKSSIYRTRRPSNQSRTQSRSNSNANSRTSSPQRTPVAALLVAAIEKGQGTSWNGAAASGGDPTDESTSRNVPAASESDATPADIHASVSAEWNHSSSTSGPPHEPTHTDGNPPTEQDDLP